MGSWFLFWGLAKSLEDAAVRYRRLRPLVKQVIKAGLHQLLLLKCPGPGVRIEWLVRDSYAVGSRAPQHPPEKRARMELSANFSHSRRHLLEWSDW